MPRETKAWILTRSIDHSSKGPLQLGQILSDPLRPSTALIPEGPPQIPEEYQTSYSEVTGVCIGSDTTLGLSFGFWGHIIGVPAGIGGGVSRTQQSQLIWEFKKLNSQTVVFGLDHIQRVLQNRHIKSHINSYIIQKGPFAPALYIVTGIRVAVDASLVWKQHIGVTGGGSGEGNQSGIPAKVGVTGLLDSAEHQSLVFKHASPFIFAYQCNQINYWPKTSQREYTSGDVQALRQPEMSTFQQQPADRIKIVGHKPVRDTEFGVERFEGEDVKIVIPPGFEFNSEYNWKFLLEQEGPHTNKGGLNPTTLSVSIVGLLTGLAVVVWFRWQKTV